MKVQIDVDPENIVKRDADDRGRITLGSDYGGDTVRIAILETNPDTTTDD
jgi:hypothetical protein